MHGEYLPALDTTITFAHTLPGTIHAFVTHTPEGGYTVVVNARLDECTIRSVIAHELRHIARLHLHSELPAAQLESDT